MPDELGKYILRDTELVCALGWKSFVEQRRGRGDLSSMDKVRHPARRLLRQYKSRGVPVVMSTAPWSPGRIQAALQRGPHKSAIEHSEFLRSEFANMVQKNQWVVLPFSSVADLPGLCISPMGVVPQHERRPRTIVDYTYSGVNQTTQPIAPMEAMQFGRALDRYICHIVTADPSHGPVYMLKVDISDGFYHVWLRLEDIAKLAVAFPTPPGEEPLVALPLALPMGWCNSPPAFSSVTETGADIANQALHTWKYPPPHRLDTMAATLPAVPATQPLPTKPQRSSNGAAEVLHSAVPLPIDRDPSLLAHKHPPLATIDVFVDDYIAAAQGSKADLQRVRRILLHAIDCVFRPLDKFDDPHRSEPSSVKKMLQGDASWSTVKKSWVGSLTLLP